MSDVSLSKFNAQISHVFQEMGLEQYLKPGVAEKTVLTYARIFKRTKDLDDPLYGVSRASFKVHRAALLRGYSSMISNRLMKLIQHDSGKQALTDETIERYRIEIPILLKKIHGVLDREKPQEKTKPASMRTRIPKSQGGEAWQSRVLNVARPPAKMAVAILWAGGFRPSEIARGVTLIKMNSGNITMRTEGSKRSDITGGGQDFKVLEIDGKSPVGLAIKHLLAGEQRVDYKRNARTLEADLELAGYKIGLDKRLNAYTFRHAASADLKRNHDVETTAKALGHVSARSQSGYGSVQQGKTGRCPIVSAEAPRGITQMIRAHAEFQAGR